MSELTTLYNLMNENNKIRFINHLKGAGVTDFVDQLQNEQGGNNNNNDHYNNNSPGIGATSVLD